LNEIVWLRHTMVIYNTDCRLSRCAWGRSENKTPCHDARERIPLWHLGRPTARTNCTSRSGARPPASPTLPLLCRWPCAIARRCELFAKPMRRSALGFRPPSTQSKPASVRSNSGPAYRRTRRDPYSSVQLMAASIWRPKPTISRGVFSDSAAACIKATESSRLMERAMGIESTSEVWGRACRIFPRISYVASDRLKWEYKLGIQA